METLTDDERRCLTALVDCLIPEDSLGPSASQAGVVEFIEGQLFGDYGAGKGMYLSAEDAVDGEGGEGAILPPLPFYKQGLAALDDLARTQTGSPMAALEPDARVSFLTAVESGLIGTSSLGVFFNQVIENTAEGYFSDPIHGGNRNEVGWRMVGFPGCGHDYRAFVGKNLPVANLVPIRSIAMLRERG